MGEKIDVYFSFRSPYSYLAGPGLLAIQADFNVTLHLRPVLPLAVRQPVFFSPENMKRVRYIAVDFPRRCEMLGRVCSWPSPDPIVQDLESFKIAEEQPYIHRLTKLGIEAERRGKGIEFAYEISNLIFGGTKDWDQGNYMSKAAARAGLNLADMDAVIATGDHAAAIEDNHKALDTAQHWGVPTCVYKDAPFFGEDRIETLRWQLTKDGLLKTA